MSMSLLSVGLDSGAPFSVPFRRTGSYFYNRRNCMSSQMREFLSDRLHAVSLLPDSVQPLYKRSIYLKGGPFDDPIPEPLLELAQNDDCIAVIA